MTLKKFINKIPIKYSEFKGNRINTLGIPKAYKFNEITKFYEIDPKYCKPLDRDNIIIYSWNIYKQKISTSIVELATMIGKADIILLQEARDTGNLTNIIKGLNFRAIQVVAFKDGEYSNGVMTLSKNLPLNYIAFKYSEPWIRFPKSGLISTYLLSNDSKLLVANFHVVNFSIGMKDFTEQLQNVFDTINEHIGPVILGGDFNTWKKARYAYVKEKIDQLNLKEINYATDQRTKMMGKILDHIFVRGVEIKEAETLDISASDHNPIRIKVKII